MRRSAPHGVDMTTCPAQGQEGGRSRAVPSGHLAPVSDSRMSACTVSVIGWGGRCSFPAAQPHPESCPVTERVGLDAWPVKSGGRPGESAAERG